jgi:hypothetical protein
MKNSTVIRTPQEAAERYANDRAFAEAFDTRLAELFRNQAKRLERLAARLEGDHTVSGPVLIHSSVEETPFGTSEAGDDIATVPLRRVIEVLKRSAGRQGLTRGQLSTYLGVESGDARLTRTLRTLKEDGTIKQLGTRRSARYLLNSGAKQVTPRPATS